MPKSPLGQPLHDFESRLDASIEKSELWALPRHMVLGMLLGVLRDLMLGGVSTSQQPRPRAGDSWMDRLPALVPFLRRTPSENAPDKSIQAPALGGLLALAEVLSYAHAAELYPELWRGWRVVRGKDQSSTEFAGRYPAATSDEPNDAAPTGTYVVEHATSEAADWEVRDIVLGRLAAPWGVLDPTHPPMSEQVEGLLSEPGTPLDLAAPTLAVLALGALRLEELPLVGDTAMQRMVGATCGEFGMFRDACVALGIALAEAAQFCMDRARNTAGDAQARWAADARTWSLPTMPAGLVTEWLQVLSGLESDQVDHLVAAFSEPQTGTGWDTEAGSLIDGFFPPFWPISDDGGNDYIVMCPWHLQSNVTQHSLVSRFSKVMSDEFDAHVSDSLEPTLLKVTAPLWERIPGVVVALNRNWSSGNRRSEFDALVYDASVNTVVHVQAKGSIPAVSPRMVARLEDTVAVGLRQLRALRSLSPGERDRVLSEALGVHVSGPEILDVLMTSSGVGSAKAWSSLGDVVPSNPVLLSAAVESARLSGTPNLAAVVAHTSELLDSLIANAKPEWKSETVPLGLASEAGSVDVTFPALTLDNATVTTFRRIAWPR